MKNVMVRKWTLDPSIRAKKSSKYSLTPQKEREVRAGNPARVGGGGAISTGRDRGDWNPMERPLRLGNAARQVAIASGEMYPECGISRRERYWI
jgi:hypothetical protein